MIGHCGLVIRRFPIREPALFLRRRMTIMAMNTAELKHQARELARHMKQRVREWHESVRKWLENHKPKVWKNAK